MRLTVEQIVLLEQTDDQGVFFNNGYTKPSVIHQLVGKGILKPCASEKIKGVEYTTAERLTSKGWRICRKYGIKSKK